MSRNPLVFSPCALDLIILLKERKQYLVVLLEIATPSHNVLLGSHTNQIVNRDLQDTCVCETLAVLKSQNLLVVVITVQDFFAYRPTKTYDISEFPNLVIFEFKLAVDNEIDMCLGRLVFSV